MDPIAASLSTNRRDPESQLVPDPINAWGRIWRDLTNLDVRYAGIGSCVTCFVIGVMLGMVISITTRSEPLAFDRTVKIVSFVSFGIGSVPLIWIAWIVLQNIFQSETREHYLPIP